MAGIVLVWGALLDVFQSVIVPRASDRRLRISAYLVRGLWRVWPSIAWHISDDDRREDFFGTFAPFAMIALLGAWVTMLIFGFGLLFFGMHEQLRPQPAGFWQSVYFAGSTLLTIGFGDITATSGMGRLVALIAGASGLSVVAVLTAFLFAVFGSFQRREVFVTFLGTRSGSPPSGIGLLELHASNDVLHDLAQVFVAGQKWTSEIMESHLAYPILAFFRSSHDYESWPGALGTLLDAATLLMTTIEGVPQGQARFMYWTGRHLCNDFSRYFGLRLQAGVGIERYEFDVARERLSAAGFRLRDADESWRAFGELRSSYAPALSAMAGFWRIPPLQWIGDRSPIPLAHLDVQPLARA